MEDINEHFLVSAFRKLAVINKSEIKEVTIGPNKTITDCDSPIKTSEPKTVEEKTDIQSKPTERASAENSKEEPVKFSNNKNNYIDIGLPVRHILRKLEMERQVQVTNAVEEYAHKINEHTKYLEEQRKKKSLEQQHQLISNIKNEENRIVKALQDYDLKKNLEFQKQIQFFEKLGEQQRRNAAMLEEKEKQRQELNAKLDCLQKLINEFSRIYTETVTCINPYLRYEEFNNRVKDDVKKANILVELINNILIECKTCQFNKNEIERASDAVAQIKVIYESCKELVSKYTELKKKPPIPDKSPQPAVDERDSNVASTVKPQKTSFTKPEPKQVNPSNISINKFINKNSLKNYQEIMSFMEKHVKSIAEFEESSDAKDFKFDCKKAVNIPVNAISDENSSHLQDKFNKLFNLLSGKDVQVGDKNINVSGHPKGIDFCTDLLAKKIVLQGDIIASNPKSAFSYATIIVSLWNVFPTFGKLFIAYLYKSCPYLVPYYVPQIAGQTDEDYYVTLGYVYVNGQIEKQDKFLKRMRGLMRLYAAILITRPKREQKTHPHGPDNGWAWQVNLLQLTPHIDITATMLHSFLETAGYHMQIVYGKMFQKLMTILIEKFMPNLKEHDSGASVARLEVLLEEYRKRGRFEKPIGLLPANFW